MNVAGSRVSSSENASARRSTSRESWFEIDRHGGHDERQRERHGGHGARAERGAARGEPLRQHGHGPHAERRHDREPDQPVADVVVVHVAELVRDDQARLGRLEVLHQRVVEHDPLRRAQPVHVRVGGGRAARGVHLVDLAHVDVGRARQLEHVGAQLAARQALEVVEQRVEHDRAGVARDRPERDHDGGARQPPAPPEAAHAEHQHGAAERREAGADRLRLDDVARVAEPVLRDQADVLGPLARDGGQRQRRDTGRDGDRGGDRGTGEHRSPEPGEPLRRAPHDQHQHAESDRRLGEVDPQLAAAERLGLLDLRLAEVGSRLDRNGLGSAVARTHHEHGGLRDDHRGDERDRQAP